MAFLASNSSSHKGLSRILLATCDTGSLAWRWKRRPTRFQGGARSRSSVPGQWAAGNQWSNCFYYYSDSLGSIPDCGVGGCSHKNEFSSCRVPKNPRQHQQQQPFRQGRRRPFSSSHTTTTTMLAMPDSSPLFQVARIPYATPGTVETIHLDTTGLLKTASIYARDLLFTLNLSSSQEDRETTLSSSSSSSRGLALERRIVSTIQPRRKETILLSFGKIQAVASLDHILLFNAHLPDVRDLARELTASFQTTPECRGESAAVPIGGSSAREPNELIFLEFCLRDTVDSYFRRLRLFEPIVDSFLLKVDNNDITSSDGGVHQLSPLKDALQAFEIQVRQSLECLEILLKSDEEMLGLLLTEHNEADQTGNAVDFSRHEHVEVLLGVYARQISNINREIHYLLQRLQSKQEFVALALSGYRNRMVRMNVHLGIAGLSLGFSTAVAGFFGMNLVNGLESSPTAFPSVLLGSGLCSVFLSLVTLDHLSGEKMRQRAKKRADETDTLTSALSDMCALDHALKPTVERGESVSKDQFRKLLNQSRQTKDATPQEVELLFDVFDTIKDGRLTLCDFPEGRPSSSQRSLNEEDAAPPTTK